MKRIPSEFAELLSARGRTILERGYSEAKRLFWGRATPIALLNGILDEDRAAACRRLIDGAMCNRLRRVDTQIPPETITGMQRNYEELLPKVMRFETAYFASRSSLAYQTALDLGLLDMMRSESLALFAEAVTGYNLSRARGVQVILYKPGDYVGPHNDHHPENENTRDGFVDLHISLTSPEVASQYLVCEDSGHFSKMYSVAINGSIAVYRLPFWHYTTPLRAKRGKEGQARRWLLLATFDIVRPSRSNGKGSCNRLERGPRDRSRLLIS